MKSMVPARRRAEEFAAAADGRPRATVSTQTQAFLEIVEQLRACPTPNLRPEFAVELRARLMEAAPAELIASGPVSHRADGTSSARQTSATKRRRGLSAAAVACLIAGTGVGVAAASQTALPGDALYPVKRGIEKFEVSTSRSDASRGEELLDQASTRLDEVRELTVLRPDDPGTSALVDQALRDFSDQAQQGGDSMLAAYQDESSDQSIVALRAFTDRSVDVLGELDDNVPSGSREGLVDAANLLERLDRAARDACLTCSALPPLELTGEFLTLPDLTQDTLDGLVEVPAQVPHHQREGTAGDIRRPVEPAGDPSRPGLGPAIAPALPPSPDTANRGHDSDSKPDSDTPTTDSVDEIAPETPPDEPAIEDPSPSVNIRTQVPTVTVPKVTAPKVTVPKVTAPKVTVPRATHPTVHVPDVDDPLDDVVPRVVDPTDGVLDPPSLP